MRHIRPLDGNPVLCRDDLVLFPVPFYRPILNISVDKPSSVRIWIHTVSVYLKDTLFYRQTRKAKKTWDTLQWNPDYQNLLNKWLNLVGNYLDKLLIHIYHSYQTSKIYISWKDGSLLKTHLFNIQNSYSNPPWTKDQLKTPDILIMHHHIAGWISG